MYPPSTLPIPKRSKQILILESFWEGSYRFGSRCESELDTKPIIKPETMLHGRRREVFRK
jgi:hypothetical protein